MATEFVRAIPSDIGGGKLRLVEEILAVHQRLGNVKDVTIRFRGDSIATLHVPPIGPLPQIASIHRLLFGNRFVSH
jgi:hypothetical protein